MKLVLSPIGGEKRPIFRGLEIVILRFTRDFRVLLKVGTKKRPKKAKKIFRKVKSRIDSLSATMLLVISRNLKVAPERTLLRKVLSLILRSVC